MIETISILHLQNTESDKNEISNLFEHHNYSYQLKHNLLQADSFKILDEHSPGVVICEADESAKVKITTEIIREINRWDSNIPIIITDTSNSPEKAISVLEAGASDYVPPSRLPLLPFIVKKEISHNQVSERNQLKGKVDLLQQIINHSTNEFFLLEPDTNNIIFANTTLLQNMGYSEDEFLKLNFEDTIAGHQKEIISEISNEFWSGKKQQITFQKDSLRKDESFYPVQIQLHNLDIGSDRLILGVGIDISDHLRKADILEKQKQKTKELKLAARYKSDYFAHLSHEMRTTLNSILLLSRILNENRPNNLLNDQIVFANTIHESTNSLLSLLNEVLDLSKIESGKMNVNIEYVNIHALCRDMERLFQPVAREKGISFKFTSNLKDEVTLKTDRIRIEQVLKNLISNALKFTEKGSVNLKVNYLKESESGIIEFQVIDTGIGIPTDKQQKIFESYVQADGISTEVNFGGTGLGLSISKKIAQLLGGTIEVQSAVGSGSTFTFQVPSDSSNSLIEYAKADKITLDKNAFVNASVVGKESSKGSLKNSNKKNGTILLIDDSETHNMALKEFFDIKFEKCITAETAKKAMEVLATQSIDCVVLDIYLPDIDGLNVVNKIRETDEIKNIPIIIYSGKSFTNKEKKELDGLVDFVLQKNIRSYSILVDKISTLLSDNHVEVK